MNAIELDGYRKDLPVVNDRMVYLRALISQ